MRIFLLKHKGATTFWNICTFGSVQINQKTLYISEAFLRKKDAKKYLDSLEYGYYYEIVGATVDKVKSDNRRKK